MKNTKLDIAWVKIQNSIDKVSKSDNKVNLTKEQLILNKLVSGLGKPELEVKKLISKELMSLLILVPFKQ